MGYLMHAFRRLFVGLLISMVWTSVCFSELTITDVGRFNFTDTSGSGANELSGIAYAGGSAFYAVSDGQAKLFALNIGVNPADGSITSASIDGSPLQLRDGTGTPLSGPDREGIIYDGTAVWIANETGPELSRHDTATGNQLDQVSTSSHAQLDVFSNVRANRSWESLSRQPNGAAFWTANEEALTVDGPLSTTTEGSVVRLQRYDDAMNPTGQWAYRTEPIDDDFISGNERSGVADVLALDGGELLVLERSFGGAHFRIGIFQVDFASATDVSQAPWNDGLIGETYTLATKTELWSHTFGLLDVQANFEGLTLGPVLDNNAQSLILVADNSGGTSHSLYGLVLLPEPATAALGDVNGDGLVNGSDVDPFLAVLLRGPFDPAADMNEDSVLNGSDISAFVAAVQGGGAHAVPEPVTVWLSAIALLVLVIYGWRRRKRVG